MKTFADDARKIRDFNKIYGPVAKVRLNPRCDPAAEPGLAMQCPGNDKKRQVKRTICVDATGRVPEIGSMEDVLFGDLFYLFAFCLGGLAFALGPIVLVHLIMARRTRAYANKTDQYIECGMEPIGDAWIRYSAVYYLYALVFVAFAVDVLYLVPVAVVYDRVFPIRDFVEVFIFVGILSLVIVYAWKKEVFAWKPKKISS